MSISGCLGYVDLMFCVSCFLWLMEKPLFSSEFQFIVFKQQTLPLVLHAYTVYEFSLHMNHNSYMRIRKTKNKIPRQYGSVFWNVFIINIKHRINRTFWNADEIKYNEQWTIRKHFVAELLWEEKLKCVSNRMEVFVPHLFYINYVYSNV